ncbi:nucleotide exchange factor GrpE [Candidatus Woesearchaeota archaeon]|nr:nucleotide exchange factor GrpE [Candidatus Woesearchaeota archaeon]
MADKKEKKPKKEDPKDTQIKELTNDLKRVQADFSNYCKRADKDKQEFIEYASANFICKLLPIIDELEIALKNIKNPEDKKGIQMVYDKVKKLLTEEGVKEITCEGKQFDPYKHEAMIFEESKNEGEILEELQKGYEMKGKILRYSKVKVSKGLSDKEKKNSEKNSLEGEQNEQNNRN